jgi:hypothetical protein
VHWAFISCGLWLTLTGYAIAQPPAEVLDLSRWKLTLPVDTDLPGRPDEIVQPKLSEFLDPGHFFVREKGIVFRAPCGGIPTRGSSYPRCELREMAAGGRDETAWSTDDDRLHTLSLKAAITQTPKRKPHVVCAQIHDNKSDLLMVRLEGEKLFIERTEGGDVMLERRYKLGTPFTLKLAAGSGHVKAWFNGDLKIDWPISRAGCYFKAGCYTQSNPDRGDDPANYGEVVVYELTVSP